MSESSYGYDYRLGLPDVEIDANGSVSTAEYDGFGSPTVLRRAGDESGRATLGAGYFTSWQPFMIDLQQKTSQNEYAPYYNVRRFYDGKGRLIQEQVAKATLHDNACSTDGDLNPDTCDILVDTWYSADGLEHRQSVPYAVAYWYSGMPGYGTPYRGQRIEPGESSPVAYTSTQYDLLGRVVKVVAPDGTETSTSYEIVSEQGRAVFADLRHRRQGAPDLHTERQPRQGGGSRCAGRTGSGVYL